MTADQLELISTDPRGRYGRALIAGTGVRVAAPYGPGLVCEELRRRSDDPDLQWRDTHPVVFVGAGSHSGACLPGDYLVTVEPPSPPN